MTDDVSQRVYHLLRWPARIIFGFAHPRLRVTGRENIPKGGAVLCANHSSLSDPVWAIVALWQDRAPRTMAKKELFSIPVLRTIIRKAGAFPVDREVNDINAVKTSMRILRSGDKLLIFPEGTRVRPGMEVKPHGGAVLLASRNHVPIVPMYITRYKKFLAPIDVIIGEPYMGQAKGVRPTPEEIDAMTEDLMKRIYALGEKK